ncbi:MAG TPA: hypothetical protein PJ982_07625 [Lacipirellulaceae bacterium]|nr:hypothetical protein [Lacipirellulaceae bacterium]
MNEPSADNWEFWDFFDVHIPPWSRVVHCRICDKVYGSEELFYVWQQGVWACRSYPECQGVGTDIRVLD